MHSKEFALRIPNLQFVQILTREFSLNRYSRKKNTIFLLYIGLRPFFSPWARDGGPDADALYSVHIMLGLAGYSVLAAPVGDAVQSLPGFGDLSSLPFKVYSGYLTVPCQTGLEPQLTG
jgi:hypothetical protein